MELSHVGGSILLGTWLLNCNLVRGLCVRERCLASTQEVMVLKTGS